MIHFFPRYTVDASDTPFGAELRRLGVPHRFFGAVLSHRYRSVFELIFVVHTRLLWFACRNAWRSLVTARPLPDVVVISSDVEAFVFGLLRALLRRRTRIVYETFIFVPRQGRLRHLHRAYIGAALRFVDVAICHARLEVEQCQDRFPDHATDFVFVPFGTTLTLRQELMARHGAASVGSRVVVSAGKSGRDYACLGRAAQGLSCQVRIVCDFAGQTQGLEGLPNVQVLDNCYGERYLETLAQAAIVVIPLAVDEVSAGQMVLLQAFALRKPVIITRTRTTADYATDGEDALMVPLGDEAALRAALQRLLGDPALCARLGAQGEQRFVNFNSTEAYVRQLVAAVGVA